MTAHALAEVSFRDPAGFVYEEHGDLRRQINLPYRENYDRLMASGLYDELVAARLLIPHEELDAEGRDPALAYRVIRPEPVEFISYPYEWSFSQYRDAALVTLEVQRRALGRGMILKDCSAYNVQFHQGRPVFIDTLSFEAYREGEPWVGYRQFCEHFLAPLALMALRDHRLGQLCRTNIDGIPLDLAVRLLPARSWARWGLAVHLQLHGRIQRAQRPDLAAITAARGRLTMSRHALLGLIDSLESTVRKLRWRPARGGWASYEENLPYTPEGFESKDRLVRELLERARARSIWDLGANTGHFSRMAAESGASTVAMDFDPACVERMYRDAQSRGETRLLPLVVDLLNPSPASGWMNRERSSIFERGRPEMVMALALIHHLAFVGNQPMENLAEFFRRLAPWLLIEFVPESDPQVRLLVAQRAGVHHEYNRKAFERCFGRHFLIVTSEAVTEQGRILYLLRRRDD
jgi:ribosomal protein L11 methylase PrmA